MISHTLMRSCARTICSLNHKHKNRIRHFWVPPTATVLDKIFSILFISHQSKNAHVHILKHQKEIKYKNRKKKSDIERATLFFHYHYP